MAHLDMNYDSFTAFLNRDDVDDLYTVNLASLNSSGVTGSVVIGTNTEADGERYINVSIAAQGLTPNTVTPQHIHGAFDEDGAPSQSRVPTLFDDADLDGMVEVLEGLGAYGDIILALTGEDGLPTTSADGTLFFIQNYELNDDTNFFSPVSMTEFTSADLLPLDLREVVLHGVQVPTGIGAGTTGEVDGSQDGLVPILPAAAGQIVEANLAQALNILADQRAVTGDSITLSDDGETVETGAGDDLIVGGAGDDVVSGGADADTIDGNAGNDVLAGSDGNDSVSGGEGDDNLGGGLGDDFVSGGEGDDTAGGGNGADTMDGGEGDDLFNGGLGDDIVSGGSGNDTLGGGAGADTVSGGTGDDLMGGGFGGDIMSGGIGNDSMGGGGGDDIVAGDEGADFLGGGAGADSLLGGAGGDRLNGGTGGDQLTGGGGTDTFIFRTGDSSATAVDRITDFADGVDMMEVQAAVTFADLTIADSGTTDDPSARVTGDGFFIEVDGITAAQLTADDFTFV